MMQNDLRNSYDLSSLLWIVAVLLAVLFSAPAIAGGNSVDIRHSNQQFPIKSPSRELSSTRTRCLLPELLS